MDEGETREERAERQRRKRLERTIGGNYQVRRAISDETLVVLGHKLTKVVRFNQNYFGWYCECGAHGHGRDKTRDRSTLNHATHAMSKGVPVAPEGDLDNLGDLFGGGSK